MGGGGYQKFMVPPTVTKMNVQLFGASGGGFDGIEGGYGAMISTYLAVSPGEIYYVFIGGMGNEYEGGYNGGGYPSGETATGGGGATDLRKSTNIEDRILIAGGGGGVYTYCQGFGGNLRVHWRCG